MAGNRSIVPITMAIIAVGGFGAALYAARAKDRRDDPFRPHPVPAGARLTTKQRTELFETIEESRSIIEHADQAWLPAVRVVDPRPLDGIESRCAPMGSVAHLFQREVLGKIDGAWTLLDKPLEPDPLRSPATLRTPLPTRIIRASDPLPTHSPEASAYLSTLADAERWIDQPTTERFDERLAEVSFDGLSSLDVLLVLDEITEPTRSSPGSSLFVPGALTARAWLYDHKKDAVVCAGIVRAASSESVIGRAEPPDLDADLVSNLIRAIPRSLHALPQTATVPPSPQ